MILLVASNPLVARSSLEYLEKDSVFRPIAQLEPANKVIVLSGMIETVDGGGDEILYEFNGAMDRYEAAIELLNQNKAQKVIFTRGLLPWTNGKPEGEVLAQLASERGIKSENILLTGKAQNTSGEAVAVKKLLSAGERPILITSAIHMSRARSIFSRHGIEVDAYPVDFQASANNRSVLDLMPSGEAISFTSLVLRELLGRAYYRLKFALTDWLAEAR